MRASTLLASAVVLSIAVAGGAEAQTTPLLDGTVDTRIGELEFELGTPTVETAQALYDELDFQRAVQAYIWALPIVGLAQARAMHEATTGATDGDIVTYEGYLPTSVWLTANVTTPYIVGFADLATTGPLEIDVPAGQLAGVVNTAWQSPVTDLGLTGPDGGNGGRYLILGPEQMIARPNADFVFQSSTNDIFFFYRVLEADPDRAEALKTAVRVFPYAQRFGPPATRFLDFAPEGAQTPWSHPTGMAYWERLSESLAGEPVADRDRFFMAMLRPLGIIPGVPFEPDERQIRILTDAALVGEAMARANSFDKRFAGASYRDDSSWDVVIQVDPEQDVDGWSELDERAAYTFEAISTSEGMVSQKPGVGQAYLGAYRDADGDALDGAETYQLTIPANPPAKQFWSVTVYDAGSRTTVQNPQQRADRSSRSEGLAVNDDGSVDLFFGPEAPESGESNWIQTNPGRGWFAYLRLYGPLEPYFERSWVLPDIEKSE